MMDFAGRNRRAKRLNLRRIGRVGRVGRVGLGLGLALGVASASGMSLREGVQEAQAQELDQGPRSWMELAALADVTRTLDEGPKYLYERLATDGIEGIDQNQRPSCAPADGVDPRDQVDAFFQFEMAGRGMPGGTYAMVRDGELIHQAGFGLKHRDEGGEVGPETQFRFASVLKMMTSAAALQQVEAGNLDLNAPIVNAIPGFTLANDELAQQITTRQALMHSTGIPDLLSAANIDGPKTPESLGEWALELDAVKLFAPPDSFWNYSNTAYGLAGLVVERSSGTTYRDYMHGEVFAKAGMTSTTLAPDAVMARGDYTFGHTLNPATGEPIFHSPDAFDSVPYAPAGYGFSTASDLAHWAALLMDDGGDVISAKSAQALQARQIPIGNYPGFDYGYGVMIENLGELELYHHGGNIPGWGAYVMWLPEYRFAMATLNNADGNMVSSMLCAFEAVLEVERPESLDYSTDPDTWGQYTGDYHVVDNLFSPAIPGVPDEYPVSVTQDPISQTLQITFPELPDPFAPTAVYSRTLRQTTFDSFAFEIGLPGQGTNPLEVTFFEDPEEPGIIKWMRNRFFVGTRMEVAPPDPRIFLPLLRWESGG
jgi:CubicO group peptidase (beta-lactamase class C family)